MNSPLLKALALIALCASTALLQGCIGLIAGGVAATTLLTDEPRTVGIVIEDERIENAALIDAKKLFGANTHLNITSYNRAVLITGEVPDIATKQSIEAIARAVSNVRGVYNELAIAPPASFASIAQDSAITARIKGRFVDSPRVRANTVKVVTEDSVVYLMGIVHRSEADAAVELARTTSGVKKVVRLFEVIVI